MLALASRPSLAQEPPLAEKVRDIQRFVNTQSEVGGLKNLEIEIGKGAKVVFRQESARSGVIQILRGSEVVHTLDLPQSFPLHANQFAIDRVRSRVGFLTQSNTTTLQIQPIDGALLKCPSLQFSPYARMVEMAGEFFVLVPGDKKLDLYRYRAAEGKCAVDSLESVSISSVESFRVASVGKELHLFLEQGKKKDGSYLEWLILDKSGAPKEKHIFPDFTPDFPSDHFYTGPSVSEQGVLISLLNKNGDTRRRGIYWLQKNESIKVMDEAGLAAWWLRRGEVLLQRGKHAYGSELVVIDAKNFQEKRKLTTDAGYQQAVYFDGNAVSFLEYKVGEPVARVSVEVTSRKKITSSSLLAAPSLGRLPVVKEIEYTQAEGSIPGMLLLPQSLRNCNSTKKVPAIVYVHGGAFETLPDGQYNTDTEALALSQMGFVVLQANYFGNLFLGKEYPSLSQRTMVEERARPQLSGLAAAGKYVQSLPCVDKEKVIYFGHSYGSILGGLFFTDAAQKKDSPYRAAILKSGRYTEENNGVLFFPSQPPAARASTRELKKRCFGFGGEENSDKQFCAKFLEDLTAIRRVANAHTQTSIFLINATDDSAADTQRFETKLREVHPSVYSWYPENAHHSFHGASEVELVERVKEFVDGLN